MSGIGTRKDTDEALRWLQKAHRRGNFKATSMIGDMYLAGDGVNKNVKTALKYFNQVLNSCEGIVSHGAATRMGLIHLHGEGVEKNTQKGIHLLEMAHHGGDTAATLAMATFYKERGDFSRSVALFEAAHWGGYFCGGPCPLATFQLGLAYFTGLGVETDTEKGLYLLLIAYDSGHAEAAETIEEICEYSSVSRADLPSMIESAKFFFAPVPDAMLSREAWQQKYALDWECAKAGRPLHSGRVPQNLVTSQNAKVHESVPRASTCATIGVHVLQYSRHPPALRAALLEGDQLKACREALAGHGFTPELPCGAKVFVRPEHFESVADAVADKDLKPWHVVASDEFLQLVDAAVRSLPSREQIRKKSHAHFSTHTMCNGCGASSPRFQCSHCKLVGYCSRACQERDWRAHRRVCLRVDDDVTDAGLPIEVSRTFLNVKLGSSMRSAPSSTNKTQSTTDADTRKGLNPRKA